MYFYIDKAKRKRVNHYEKQRDFDPEATNKKYQTIEAGEKCLVFCNGTIGRGRISYNYKKEDAIKMLKELINKLEAA
ncbi:MAG: hypothetical protein ACO2ZP_04925 [Bacteriovoracaceae bacterium]